MKQTPSVDPKAWADTCAKAIKAVKELSELQSIYAGQYNKLDSGEQDTEHGELLSAIACDLDLDSVLVTLEEASELELPVC